MWQHKRHVTVRKLAWMSWRNWWLVWKKRTNTSRSKTSAFMLKQTTWPQKMISYVNALTCPLVRQQRRRQQPPVVCPCWSRRVSPTLSLQHSLVFLCRRNWLTLSASGRRTARPGCSPSGVFHSMHVTAWGKGLMIAFHSRCLPE